MLLSHFNWELDKTAIIFEFLGKSFSNLQKRFLDRTVPLKLKSNKNPIEHSTEGKKLNLKLSLNQARCNAVDEK